MSRSRAVLREAPRAEPRQEKLPLPPVPERMFMTLARNCDVGGGPVRKLVFLVVASYCPGKVSQWEARGYPSRETLRRICQLANMDTLDRHLRALREDSWMTWTHRRGKKGQQGASEFTVRLAPLREALTGESSPFIRPKEVQTPESQNPTSWGSGTETRTPRHGGLAENQNPTSWGTEVAATAAKQGSTLPLSGADVPGGRCKSDGERSSDEGAAVESRVAAKNPERASEKQIKLLEVCADRLNAEPDPDIWRAANRATIQRQIRIAMLARDEKPRHRHEAEAEILIRSGEDGGILHRDVVQRCRCGAVRSVSLNRSGGEVDMSDGWRLCGEIAQSLDTSRSQGDVDLFALNGAGDVELTVWHDGQFTWSDVEIRIAEQDG